MFFVFDQPRAKSVFILLSLALPFFPFEHEHSSFLPFSNFEPSLFLPFCSLSVPSPQLLSHFSFLMSVFASRSSIFPAHILPSESLLGLKLSVFPQTLLRFVSFLPVWLLTIFTISARPIFSATEVPRWLDSITHKSSLCYSADISDIASAKIII